MSNRSLLTAYVAGSPDPIVGTGEVIFQPDEGVIYLMGVDGRYSVLNVRYLSSFSVRPLAEDEDPFNG